MATHSPQELPKSPSVQVSLNPSCHLELPKVLGCVQRYLMTAGQEWKDAEANSQRIIALTIETFHTEGRQVTTEHLSRRALAMAIGEASKSQTATRQNAVPAETLRPMGPAMKIRAAKWLRLRS